MPERKKPVASSSLEASPNTPSSPQTALSRRFFLGGMASLGVGATASLAACPTDTLGKGPAAPLDAAA